MSLSVLKAWARDYKRSAALALGVIMAIALFTSLNINIDASSARLLDAIISNLPADALVYRVGPLEGGPEGGWPSLADNISAVEPVIDVETVIYFPLVPAPYMHFEVNGQARSLREATCNYTKPIYVGSLSEGLLEKAELTVVEGSWNLTGHGVILSSRLAKAVGAEVGDELVLVVNMTLFGQVLTWRSPELEVRGIVYVSEEAVSYLLAQLVRAGRPIPGGAGLKAPLLMCLSYGTLRELVEQLPGGRRLDLVFLYYVWADRDRLLDPWNLDATEERLSEFETELRSSVQEYGADVIVYLSSAVSMFRSALNGIRFVTGALSFPVFLLCWYLVLTAGYLISGAKRREIGLLRVRGASSRSIFLSYMLTALLVGLLGSLLGVLAGMGVAQAYFALSGEELPAKVLAGPLEPEMMCLELGLGCAICLVASVKPARMASRLAPVEATKEYVEAEAVEGWKPGKLVLASFILGSVKMAEWAAGIRPLEILESVQGLPFFITVAFYIYAVFDAFILNFLGPIFFIYGSTCLLVRSSKRLYKMASALARPLGPIREVVSRNLSRNPVRASRVAFLISIAIAFGSVMSLLAASVMDAQVRTARAVVGSDVRVEVFEGVGPDFAQELTALEGVEEATAVLYGPWLEVKPAGPAYCYVVDPRAFSRVAYIEEDFCQPDMREALAEMSEDSHKVLVSEALADDYHLDVGDELLVGRATWIEGGGSYETVKVAGVVKVFPGSVVSPFAQDYFLVLSYDLSEELGLTDLLPYFLVKVRAGHEPRDVAEAIEEAFPDLVSRTYTVDEVLAESPLVMVGEVIYSFLRQSFVCSLAAATSGLALTALIGVRERTYEIGLLRARGMERKQVILALAYEYLIVSIIGLAIGIATGLTTVFGLTGMMSDFWPIKVRMVFPIDFWAFTSSGVALFLASSVLPAAMTFKRTVVETIRFR